MQFHPESGGVKVRDQLGYEPTVEELDKLLAAMKKYRDYKWIQELPENEDKEYLDYLESEFNKAAEKTNFKAPSVKR